ncbi:hypothetical protein J6590_010543 [Homalodisca vitripennis]|nr:hypothetical protein J6590_010543 [Homalodisca vitripennis]
MICATSVTYLFLLFNGILQKERRDNFYSVTIVGVNIRPWTMISCLCAPIATQIDALYSVESDRTAQWSVVVKVTTLAYMSQSPWAARPPAEPTPELPLRCHRPPSFLDYDCQVPLPSNTELTLFWSSRVVVLCGFT